MARSGLLKRYVKGDGADETSRVSNCVRLGRSSVFRDGALVGGTVANRLCNSVQMRVTS